MPLFWLRSAVKVMVRAAETYMRSCARVAVVLQLTLLHQAGVGALKVLEQAPNSVIEVFQLEAPSVEIHVALENSTITYVRGMAGV